MPAWVSPLGPTSSLAAHFGSLRCLRHSASMEGGEGKPSGAVSTPASEKSPGSPTKARVMHRIIRRKVACPPTREVDRVGACRYPLIRDEPADAPASEVDADRLVSARVPRLRSARQQHRAAH